MHWLWSKVDRQCTLSTLTSHRRTPRADQIRAQAIPYLSQTHRPSSVEKRISAFQMSRTRVNPPSNEPTCLANSAALDASLKLPLSQRDRGLGGWEKAKSRSPAVKTHSTQPATPTPPPRHSAPKDARHRKTAEAPPKESAAKARSCAKPEPPGQPSRVTAAPDRQSEPDQNPRAKHKPDHRQSTRRGRSAWLARRHCSARPRDLRARRNRRR